MNDTRVSPLALIQNTWEGAISALWVEPMGSVEESEELEKVWLLTDLKKRVEFIFKFWIDKEEMEKSKYEVKSQDCFS